MGTYEELKAAIQQVIRTNGNNEITGALLQNALLSIVNVVGANATFAGIATPNTNPGTADQNVFYLATEAGMYVNFGGIVINKGEAVILSNKTGNWVKTTSGFATQQQLTELSAEVLYKKNYTEGAILDAGNNVIAKEGYAYSDYIPVTPSAICVVNYGTQEDLTQIIELGSDKNKVDYWNLSASATSRKFTLTSQTHYIRFGFKATNASVVNVVEDNVVIWTAEQVGKICRAIAEVSNKVSEVSSEVSEVSEKIKDIIPSQDDFTIVDAHGNVAAKVGNNGIEMASKTYKVIEDGRSAIVVCDSKGFVFTKISKDSLCKNFKNAYVRENSHAALSWVDDDFNALDYEEVNVAPPFQKLHDRCIETGMRLDFASSEMNEKYETLAHSWESEGFRFVVHPKHQGWFDNPSIGYYFDLDLARKSLIFAIRYHKERLISNGEILIYPGGSGGNAEIRNLCKQYCECGIAATLDEANKGVTNSQYQLKRISIDTISAERTKSQIKSRIKEYLEDGCWVILYTHIGAISDLDTIDETSVSLPNVLEIAEYADSLCKMRSTAEIWKERKMMFNL